MTRKKRSVGRPAGPQEWVRSRRANLLLTESEGRAFDELCRQISQEHGRHFSGSEVLRSWVLPILVEKAGARRIKLQ